jgi:arsenate reductase (thioredoxin)
MAEGFLKSFDPGLDVASAGTYPARRVHPYAIQVMDEIGIDISSAYTKNVDEFIHDSFDYVITVCDHAKESCPVFRGKVDQRIHIGFRDPAAVFGTPEEVLAAFRSVRDEIKKRLFDFYISNIKRG